MWFSALPTSAPTHLESQRPLFDIVGLDHLEAADSLAARPY